MADTLLKPGDTVKLRGDVPSHRMTVDSVWQALMGGQGSANGVPAPAINRAFVRCVWFSTDSVLREGTFNPDALELV